MAQGQCSPAELQTPDRQIVMGGNAGQAEQHLQTGTHCCMSSMYRHVKKQLVSKDFDVGARAVDCLHAA